MEESTRVLEARITEQRAVIERLRKENDRLMLTNGRIAYMFCKDIDALEGARAELQEANTREVAARHKAEAALLKLTGPGAVERLEAKARSEVFGGGTVCVQEPIPAAVLAALEGVLGEYRRAKAKHGEQTPDGHCLSEDVASLRNHPFRLDSRIGQGAQASIAAYADLRRLATLTEEVGEVGRALTYDKDHAGALRKELIQVATMAVAWASILPASEGMSGKPFKTPEGSPA